MNYVIESKVHDAVSNFLINATNGNYDLDDCISYYNDLYAELNAIYSTAELYPQFSKEALAIALQLKLISDPEQAKSIWDAIPKEINNDDMLIGWLQALDWVVNHSSESPLREARLSNFVEKLKVMLYDKHGHESCVAVNIDNVKELQDKFIADIAVTARDSKGHTNHIESGTAEYDKQFNFKQIQEGVELIGK